LHFVEGMYNVEVRAKHLYLRDVCSHSGLDLIVILETRVPSRWISSFSAIFIIVLANIQFLDTLHTAKERMSKERLKNVPKHLMEDTTDIENENVRQLSSKTKNVELEKDEMERQNNLRNILQKKISSDKVVMETENLINCMNNVSVKIKKYEPVNITTNIYRKIKIITCL
jgi:hypothetical protein